MSPVSLPTKTPFNLGGLVRPSEVRPYGLTGSLPLGLPFNLSSGEIYTDVPYGSIGWELICRSHADFQTELVRTNDFTTITFSRELSAIGAASFSLNLSHPLFQDTLANGSSIEELFDYENLWEIRFDNKIRFQCLGTAIADSQVNENETATATVTGSGIGKVLEWGSVYPDGYPDKITKKLETLTDSFSGDKLDTSIWENTSATSNITITTLGAKQEARIDRNNYTQTTADAYKAYLDAQTAYNAKNAEYKAIFKDKNSTAAQKQAVTKELNEARKLMNDNQAKWTTQGLLKAQAEFKDDYASGNADPADSFGHIRLNLSQQGLISLISGEYDLKSSGLSAGIDVGPSTSYSPGIINTILKLAVKGSESNYARIYKTRINYKERMVAEVSNNSDVAIQDWEFEQSLQKFWRIREDNGYIVFETSPKNDVWTERFRAPYSWPATNVLVYFQLEWIGDVGIRGPLEAYMYKLNESAIPAVDSAIAKFRELLSDTQARGTIPFVEAMFTDYVDSRGLNWIGLPKVSITEGSKLSDVLSTLTQIQQADWIMDNDFKLRIYQKTKEDSTIPPVYFRKDDVVFHEAGSQISKNRTRDRGSIANSIVGKNSSGQYAYIEDSESINKFSKREAFVSAGNADDLPNLALVLDATLQDSKDEKSSWKVVVAADQPGRRVFEDYDVGDWISIENIDSNNNVTVGQWRVLAIAVQIQADGITTVELTLQSRIELLAARLKAQVEAMSASTVSGGASVVGGISAAQLIQQATLSGLRDVVIPNPVEGDVLTYSGGFWVPVAPGDKTVPNIPVISSVYSNVYYPADGISVRAQAQITWNIPTNEDGSFVTDGHHFEIRYRPDVTVYYPATWEEAHQYDWEDVYIWGQPTIPPITNSGWQTTYVSWDDNSTVLQELTPGVNYEIQIRAVDSSTPQHFSAWSDIYTFSAQRDTLAPPKPAPPVIASSYLSIQVTHYLGKAEGGTFNLPPDMAHLEVHVGGPAFYPDDTSRVGKIIADNGLIRSGTPVIQTFNVDSTENVWVRVIAVDQAGNKSAPSNAVTATINLIDDAHISDLTASKITAGTISSSIILGGVIKTAESGARAEMNFEGFRIYSEDDDATVSLLGNPATNGNFLLIKDLEDPTITLAGIDGTGRGSFQDISITNTVTIDGEDLLEDIINPRAKGVISIGSFSDYKVVGGGPATERGFLEISFIAEEARTYMISATTTWESTDADDRLVMTLRDGGAGDPTLASPRLQTTVTPSALPVGYDVTANIIYAGTFTAGLHRILWTFYAGTGNATVNPSSNGNPGQPSLIWVEDVGLPATDTVIINDGGVDEYVAPGSPSNPVTNPTKPSAPKPKVRYTKTYSCTWSGTYRSNGGYSSSHGSTMVQGDSGADNYLNDARSLCGFNYQQIMNDTKGATIESCYITLYANHWYWNDGGTARIGTHNYTGRPSSWANSRVVQARVSSSNWPKPGKRKVNLGTTIGNEFKSGSAKGIALGPTNGTKTQYGRFNGNGQSNEPVLTITYVK